MCKDEIDIEECGKCKGNNRKLKFQKKISKTKEYMIGVIYHLK